MDVDNGGVFGLVLLTGFGVAFVLGGIYRVFERTRRIWIWIRTLGGETVQAQIVERRAVQDHKGDAPPSHFGTLRWSYGFGEQTAELQIPERWAEFPEGESVPIRVHPSQPSHATITHWSSNPAWQALQIAVGVLMVLMGLWMLAIATANGCQMFPDLFPDSWRCVIPQGR